MSSKRRKSKDDLSRSMRKGIKKLKKIGKHLIEVLTSTSPSDVDDGFDHKQVWSMGYPPKRVASITKACIAAKKAGPAN